MNKDSPLKDVTGRYLTRGLLDELSVASNNDKYPTRCSLKEAHDLYMEIADPTEYEFARALLYSPDTNFWDHWNRLLNTNEFMAHLARWREELEIQIRSEAIKSMIDLARSKQKGAAIAAKWVAERGWEPKRGAGRPTKDHSEREKKIAEALTTSVNADAKRLGVDG